MNDHLKPHYLMLASARSDLRLDPAWRARSVSLVEGLLKLASQAGDGRLRIEFLEILGSCIRLLLQMKVPVPIRQPGKSEVEATKGALIGINYPREAMIGPVSGLGIAQVLSPHAIFHPNVSMATGVICLGPSLPTGIRLSDLMHMCYGALSMQLVNMDVMDPAGVLNPEAAELWIQNRDRIPLTRASLLQC